jgi:hypothetical protein
MRRTRWLPILLILVTASALGTAAGGRTAPDAARMAVAGAAVLAVGEEEVPDPFPIRRVRLTEAQLPDAIQGFDPGVLVRLPRDEFEARVRKAGRAAVETRFTPRVVEARYTATLAGDDLTGTAEWVVLNPCGRPAALPLDPLRLALRDPTWADGQPAVLGMLGPGFPAGPAVWVEGSGRQVLRAGWSAAGTPEPGQRRYELRVPPAPAATLELTLPADRTPAAASADALLTGPFPVAEDGSLRAWRFRFGGRSAVVFAVRAAGGGGPGAVQASLVARYDVSPGQVACSFEYDLQPARGPVAEWVFTLDPGLRVTDVVANNRAGWRVEPGSRPGDPRRLRVSLREPGAGGKVVVAAVDTDRGPSVPLPMARPDGALIDDERLEVRIAPEVSLEEWNPGDYRVIDSSVGPDQVRVTILTGTLLPPGPSWPFRRPPWLQVSGAGPEFTTAEAVEWHPDADRVTLSARVTVRVRRGALFQLTLRTPPGFALDRLTTTPDDLAGYTGPAGGSPGVRVEFPRPLTTGQEVELRFDFRGPRVAPTGNPFRVPFPRLTVEGAGERNGWVGVYHGPEWSAFPQPGSPPAKAPGDEELDPPPPPDAVAVYPYRGPMPDGWLTLTPVRPNYSVETTIRVGAAGGQMAAMHRFALDVRAGAVPSVAVFEVGPPGKRTWRVIEGENAVASAVPFWPAGFRGMTPLLASTLDPWAAVIGSETIRRSPWAAGTFWVVRFARPATERVVLEATAPLPEIPDHPDLTPQEFADRVGRTWFPRMILCGRAEQGARVEFDPPFAGRFRGALSSDPKGCGTAFDQWFPLWVVIERGQPPAPAAPPPPPAAAWAFDGLYLVTIADAVGPAEFLFGGSITSAGGPALPVVLPAGAEVRSACVGGHWLTPGECRTEPSDGGQVLTIPVPAGGRPVRFEVRSTLPASGSWLARRVESPVPELPGGPAGARRWWVLPAGVLPGWPARGWEPAELPPLLDGSAPVRLGGGRVTRFSGEAAVVVPERAAVAAGLALAAVVLAVGWIGAQWPVRAAGWFLFAVVVAAGLAVLLGPPGWDWAAGPPLVAALFAAAAVAVARGLGKQAEAEAASPEPGPRVAAAVTAIVALCSLVLLPSRAQPPAPATVFVLPGPADAPDREVMLAPRAVLDQLAAASALPRPSVVLTAATYDGRADEAVARFTATFTAVALDDGEPVAALPLADARLERVRVNGKPAHPVAVRPDLYTVPLPGRGRHEIEVAFAVPVGLLGPEREVRFGVPEVPASRLTFAAPGSARQVQVVGRLGARQVSTDAGAVRVEADLGAVRAVQLRWRQGAAGNAVVKAREGCVWEVSESGAELTACYQVRVEQGTVPGLRFDLPEELEVLRVAVRPLDAPGGSGGVLRNWSHDPADRGDRLRRLRLDFQAPTGGRLLVTLVCVPRHAPTRQPMLRFPRLAGAETEAWYALRPVGVAVEAVGKAGLIDHAGDDLYREFQGVADLRLDPATPIRVYRPVGGAANELRPTLRPGPEPPTITQEVSWRVGPHRADAEGVITWAVKGDVPVLEFLVPGVRVLEVRGADVAGWSQPGLTVLGLAVPGPRVQVWFRKPTREGELWWVGTVTPTPSGKPPPDPLVFEPVVPQVLDGKPGSETVRVRVADGWAVRVDRDRGWEPAATDGREWAFRADGSPPPVRLQLFAPRPDRPARGFALIDVSGPAVGYRGVVEVPIRPGRPHHLVVSTAGLPEEATAELEVPPGVAATARPDSGPVRAWDLDVPASPAAVVRLAVAVRFPAGAGEQGLRLPIVTAGVGGTVPEPGGVVDWVGVTGAPAGRPATLEGATRLGLPALDRLARQWPGEFDRLRRAGGTVWAVPDGADPPRLILAPPAPAAKAALEPPSAAPAAPPAEVQASDAGRVRAAVAAGWCLTVGVLAVLFGRFPRSTWPEQLGLLGGLFGVAVAGGWWLALPVLAAARGLWLARAAIAR